MKAQCGYDFKMIAEPSHKDSCKNLVIHHIYKARKVKRTEKVLLREWMRIRYPENATVLAHSLAHLCS